MCEAVQNNLNQYAPSKGLLHLRNSISKAYSVNLGMAIDPEDNVLITQGANQGIFSILIVDIFITRNVCNYASIHRER